MNKESLLILTYGIIKNGNVDETEKLHNIFTVLESLIKKYKIDHIVIEKEFYSRNVKTLMKLSHVHGVILLLIDKFKKPYTYYAATTIKSVVLKGIKRKDENGKKIDTKKVVAGKVIEIYNESQFVKPYNDDVTDALAIAYCFIKKEEN